MNLKGKPVLIIGAGPVGLTLGWLLNLAGVPVHIFEEQDTIPSQLRASTFHPPTLDLFSPSGITSDLHKVGRKTRKWQIRMYETGERAEFDLKVISSDTKYPYRLQCPQVELCKAIYKRLDEGICHFGFPVSSIKQNKNFVSLTADNVEITGSIVVGCDGARSLVRKIMGVDFVGSTYPESTILITTDLPIEEHLEGLSGVNYVWTKEGTFSLLKLPNCWRISLHPPTDEREEDALEDISIKKQILRIMPSAKNINIFEKRIYKVHQRIASSYRKGRMFLAGDSAHLNSPKGGMGMNGGIHDAWSLAKKIISVFNGENSIILDQYERQRRTIALEDIIAQTNKKREIMMAKSTEEKVAYLKELQSIAANPALSRQYLLRSSMIEGLRRAEKIR